MTSRAPPAWVVGIPQIMSPPRPMTALGSAVENGLAERLKRPMRAEDGFSTGAAAKTHWSSEHRGFRNIRAVVVSHRMIKVGEVLG